MPMLNQMSHSMTLVTPSVAAVLLSFNILQYSADVAGQFTAASPTCPGDTFTFRCTVTGDTSGITIWRVGGSSECSLVHNTPSAPGPCGSGSSFIATTGAGFGTTNVTSFSSTLSGTATPALNGTLVECFGPAFFRDADNLVGKSTIQILAPPSIPTLSCVGLSEDVSGAVNVTVSWTLSGGDSADFYLISITTNAPQTPYGRLLNITTASVTQHELTGFMTGYEYNITVRGVNCGGQEGRESEPLTFTPQGTANMVLRVVVVDVSSSSYARLNCTLLSGFIGSAHCTVQYGTDPTYMDLPYFAESTETGTAGDIISVVLREQLNSSTVYYYTVSAVSGDVTVTVQGNFTTPQYNCSLSELQIAGLLPDDKYPQCHQDQDTVTSITIPNGVVNVTCYSGRQFVSVASHVCDEGYQPNATSSVRVCRDNGLWSGTIIACNSVQTTVIVGAAISTNVAVGFTVGTIALLVGVLAGMLIYHCIIKHQFKSFKPEPSPHQPQQAVPSSNPLQQTSPEYEEVVELKQNRAYELAETSIQMRSNEAYRPIQN